MEFVKPLPFAEAVEKLGGKNPIRSDLRSAAWRDVPVALRERAFFSSRVESLRFLQRAREGLADWLHANRELLPDGSVALKRGSRAQFVEQMRAFLEGEGVQRSEGGLTDLTSEKRLGLIFDTQIRQANDYGYWRQGMDADVLEAFPAQRFIRVQEVKEPRTAHTQYEGGVWLKTDPIWARINEDFGVPWGPWGWGCGHDVEDVSREEAEALGLLAPGQSVTPDMKPFNENLQARSSGLDADFLAVLRRELGDQLVVEGEALRWRGPAAKSALPETEADAHTPPLPLPAAAAQAVRDYTGPAAETINRALWQGEPDNAARNLADRISQALARLPDYRGSVHAGQDLDQAAQAAYVPGNTVNHWGFTSASTLRSRAYAGNTQFEIVSRHGKNIARFSRWPEEAEVVFDQDTRFRVLSREVRGGRLYLRLEEA